MQMTNRDLQGIVQLLNILSLAGKESRMRTRFIRLTQPQLDEIEKARLELLTTYSNKDAEGNPLTRTENGQGVYDIPNENLPAFSTELNFLFNETFTFDELDERKEMLLSVRDAILNCSLPLSGEEAILYDRWCEIFENIQ